MSVFPLVAPVPILCASCTVPFAGTGRSEPIRSGGWFPWEAIARRNAFRAVVIRCGTDSQSSHEYSEALQPRLEHSRAGVPSYRIVAAQPFLPSVRLG